MVPSVPRNRAAAAQGRRTALRARRRPSLHLRHRLLAHREVLDGSRAIVFARELESYRRIQALCDARLAHDGAFYLDYAPYRGRGDGTLNAFRTDREAAPGRTLPPGNDDISATAPSLDAWLERIASAGRVRTDRAHVLIAAALMGKPVEYAGSAYFKVDALAATLPPEADVTRLEDVPAAPRRPTPLPPAPGRDGLRALGRPGPGFDPARVTVAILSHERPGHIAAAVASVLDTAPGVRVAILDHDSGPSTRAELAVLAEHDAVTVSLSDVNPGCGVGRQRLAEGLPSELVLFLDDDAELMPGALANLVAELDAHPGCQAVTPLVADQHGDVILCGGTIEAGADVARFTLDGYQLPADDPAVPATGPSDWVAGVGLLVRRAALLDIPFDPAMRAYYEDNDWSVRVAQRHPEPFRRCREAVVLHHLAGREPLETHLAWGDMTVRRLAAHARFLEAHGVLMHSGGEELRELLGVDDPVAARLLLRLVSAYGPDWLLAEWAAGDLGALLTRAAGTRAELAGLHARLAELEAEHTWLHERHATLERVEQGGWWRLRGRLQPAVRLARRARNR